MKILYHLTNHPLVGQLKPNYQGIHLAGKLSISRDLAKNRNLGSNTLYLYKVYVDFSKLYPLMSNIDLMDWGAEGIAKLLLARYYKTTTEGASAGIKEDGTNWEETVPGEQAVTLSDDQINKLTKQDLLTLQNLVKTKNRTNEGLQLVRKILEQSLHINCIIYKNYGENSEGSPCLMLFDSSVIDHYEKIPISKLFENKTYQLAEKDLSLAEKIETTLLASFEVQKFSETPQSIFIFPDGKIASADLHADMMDVLYDEDLVNTDDYNYYGSDFVVLETKAIRASYLEAYENYFELPSRTKLTSEQYVKLTEFLDFDQKLYDRIQVATNGYQSRFVSYSFDEYTTDDIIDRVRRYYSSGHLYEAILNEVYPKEGESKEDFISRFMSVTKDEYPDQKQRLAIAYSYWDKKNKKESLQEAILNKAIDNFGLMFSPIKAGYILADGRMLDFSGGQSRRTIDHREVADLYNLDKDVNDLMMDFINETHAIRSLPEIPGFTLVYKPTEAQYNSIWDIISKLGTDGLIIEIWAPNGNYITSWEYTSRISINRIILDIKNYFKNGTVPVLLEQKQLIEDTRSTLIAKSRTADKYKGDTSRGTNRFERKKYSKVASLVRQYNDLNMNDFFKKDSLLVKIPVTGETNSYVVSIKLEGVCEEIARNIKSNANKLEFKTVIQALTKVFNTKDIYVNCTCDDFRFRYQHQLIINNNNVEGTDKDPGPGTTGIANTSGKGCKHVLLCLNNGDWLIKVASVIKNYIFYAEEHMQKAFMKIIFPKLYGIPADEAIDQNLVAEDTNLDTEKHIIELINDWAKNRGKFQKGSNKNPISGTGGRSKNSPNTDLDKK